MTQENNALGFNNLHFLTIQGLLFGGYLCFRPGVRAKAVGRARGERAVKRRLQGEAVIVAWYV